MRLYKLKFNRETFAVGKACRVLFAFVIFISFSYIYFVQNSVFNIVERERFNREIFSASGKISQLEAEYIKSRSGISMATALKLGFKEDFNKINFANVDSGLVEGGLSFSGITNE